MTGKHQRSQDLAHSNPLTRAHIAYDYTQAKESVLCDWVEEVPCFPHKQFEHTFSIKCHMVNPIINHLAQRDRFWINTVCRVGKEMINPYAKLLRTVKMICYGVSGSAFIHYHQFGETTIRQCVSKLGRGLVECRPLSEVYLRKPSEADS